MGESAAVRRASMSHASRGAERSGPGAVDAGARGGPCSCLLQRTASGLRLWKCVSLGERLPRRLRSEGLGGQQLARLPRSRALSCCHVRVPVARAICEYCPLWERSEHSGRSHVPLRLPLTTNDWISALPSGAASPSPVIRCAALGEPRWVALRSLVDGICRTHLQPIARSRCPRSRCPHSPPLLLRPPGQLRPHTSCRER